MDDKKIRTFDVFLYVIKIIMEMINDNMKMRRLN